MALKIRLRQQGRKNQRVYRLVLSDSRSPRDGKFIEILGWYNPFETEAEKILNVDASRVEHWLSCGAILTEKAAALIGKSAPTVFANYREKLLKARDKSREKRKASPAKPKKAAVTA